MYFDQPYNRHEFVSFLRQDFLPENDFVQEETPVTFPIQTQYCCDIATKLGTCQSLDLVIYEIRHHSKSDARVGMSKEAFRLLANEFEDKALVIFVPEDNADNYRLSFIEITLHQDEDSSWVKKTYSNPRRYSYYLGKGIAWYTPNKYLNKKDRVTSIEDLRSRFSVEVLTKSFYQELADWYAWAIEEIRFPNKLDDSLVNKKANAEGAIRLITRLIFVWFLKQKGLIPNDFFDENAIREKFIEDFEPNKREDNLFGYKSKESVYYKAILQNLFFAMLNCPVFEKDESGKTVERKFRRLDENGKADSNDFDDNKLMRYEKYFKNSKAFIEVANRTIPFLNGGLFDCLDDKRNRNYIDGFSDKEEVQKKLIVPDYLFFGEDIIVDLSNWYEDKKKKKVKVSGLIRILNNYNFTVEENTPFDQEVSLDPELLGKVFENLLASYNPETQTTARKQTGSFYTPREIVQYMVDESLVAHLKRIVGEDLEPEYRKLVAYTDEELNLTDEQKHQIMKSIYDCKVLDPACGSGAFPVGMLQQMVHILSRMDPSNDQWKKMILDEATNESRNAFLAETSEERKKRLNDIHETFEDQLKNSDYTRKLYLIENCLYGVDIQSIAIQICKLRFFISLVVDQETNNNPEDNFGIRPLPNLEAKFVAANTLIGLEKKDVSLFDNDNVKKKMQELKGINHRLFYVKHKAKKRLRAKIRVINDEIAALLKDNGIIGNEEAQQLSRWNRFDQNSSASFFDAEWMFGVKDGFDIVIGNPPYGIINKKQNKGESISVPADIEKYYKTSKEYLSAQGGGLNIFRLFIIKSIRLLCNNGVFSEIFPLAFAGDISSYKTRKFVFDNCTIISFEAFPERDNPQKRVFENAKMSVCILTLKKSKNYAFKFKLRINTDKYVDTSIESSVVSIDDLLLMDKKYCSIPTSEKKDMDVLLKIFSNSKHFSFYGKCNTGEIDMTFCKKAFTTNSNDAKMIRGANVMKYYITKNISQGENLYLNNQALQSIKKLSSNPYSLTRIVMQGITGINEQNRLKMTIVNDCYCANSVNYCSFKKEEDIYAFLAIFNSKLLNYVFKQFSTNSNVNGYEVDNLPIHRNIKIEERLSKLSLRVLQMKDPDHLKDTSIIENEIDRLVYKLYGLTFDEILIIDPQTPITREEYEKGGAL